MSITNKINKAICNAVIEDIYASASASASASSNANANSNANDTSDTSDPFNVWLPDVIPTYRGIYKTCLDCEDNQRVDQVRISTTTQHITIWLDECERQLDIRKGDAGHAELRQAIEFLLTKNHVVLTVDKQ